MSQKSVQLVIARLLTDEDLRTDFLRDPLEALTAFRDQGFDLTAGEIEALIDTDREVWTYAARRIHPHLQRCSLRAGRRASATGRTGWRCGPHEEANDPDAH